MEFKVELAAPYPETAVAGLNRRLANMLSQDLAGSASEMTTVHQYTYQSWILHDTHPQEAELLRELAVVETRHFHILGRLIYLLGGSPQCASYQRARPVIWNGRMVNYTVSFKQQMTINLSGERMAWDAYRNQAQASGDPYVAACLRRLAEDEKHHVDIFKQIVDSFQE